MLRTLSILLLFATTSALALPVGNPRIPDSGLWWVPGENGHFLHLDVGPDGYVFATVSGFASGFATYLVLQGPLELAPVDETSTRPAIGTLASPFYEVANGACFGCEWQAPIVRPSLLGSGTLTFFASDELTLDAFGKRTTFRRFPLYSTAAGAPSDRYVGQWLALLRTNEGLVRDVVEIAHDDDTLTFRFPTRTGADAPAPAEASLSPCGSNRLGIADDGSLRGRSNSGRGCIGNTYVFHERDGALYGMRRSSIFSARIASEVLLYRVPPRWLLDSTSQSIAPGNARVPDTGLWWVPDRNGEFLHLDVGPDGYVFATVSGFDGGRASYLVLQGPMQLEPADTAASTLASLSSPLYSVSGGTCFGCAWRAPIVQDSAFGSGTLRFSSGDSLALDAFGTTTTYRRFPLFTTAAGAAPERYLGRWLVLMRGEHGVSRDFVRLQRADDRVLVLPLDATMPSRSSFLPCGGGGLNVSADGSLFGVSYAPLGCVIPTYDFQERDGALYGRRQRDSGEVAERMAREMILYRVPDDW